MSTEKVEDCKTEIHFEISQIQERHSVFSIEKFNYGHGTFYQKFKNLIPVVFHNHLKWLESFEISVVEGHSGKFQFVVNGVTILKAEEVASILVNLVHLVHNVEKSPVNVRFESYVIMKFTTNKEV